MMKATIKKRTISIQLWTSKPKKLNFWMRNATVPAPFLCRIRALAEKIYYFYIIENRPCGTSVPAPRGNAQKVIDFGRQTFRQMLFEARVPVVTAPTALGPSRDRTEAPGSAAIACRTRPVSSGYRRAR
jgi:hypothetical protein